MPKQEQEKTTIELEDGDMTFDDIEEGTSEDSKDGLEKFMADAIEKARKQSIAYTDKRIAQVNEKLAKHQEILDTHTTDIADLKKVVEGMATGKVQAVAFSGESEAPKHKNILDATLGTVGGVAHGVIDTAAFLCESVIDLVTLGRARRPQ